MMGQTARWLTWLGLCVGISGCVERTLTIQTEPPGAQVFLNDEEIGTSPVTVGFAWYGDYHVHCRKAGFAPLRTHRELPAPWYDHFPADLVVGVLYPGTVRDEHTWTFALSPRAGLDRDTLIADARRLARALDDPNVIEPNQPGD